MRHVLGPLLIALVGAQPVLTHPVEARSEAQALGSLAGAEALLLLGDPRVALEKLGDAAPPDPSKSARFLRLQADVRAALGDRRAAEGALAALREDPRWEAHAQRRSAVLEAGSPKRAIARYGLGLFACALAVLVLGGARELLRIRREGLVLGIAVLGALGLAGRGDPRIAPAFGLVSVAVLSIGHAVSAARRRVDPSPRGRLLLAVVALLAVLGVVAAASGYTLVGVDPNHRPQ